MDRKHNPKLTGCARTLRKNMTREERHLWYDFLRTYQPRFLRQKVIDEYIVDFYCREAALVIELDGSQHYEEAGLEADRFRTERLKQRGLTVLRIPNNAVNQNFREVCAYIDRVVEESLHRLRRSPSL
ncbi:endonuclease domain-containing protein [Evtepia sp.]|uniref:endonuclease domain-containing protein n=1 Tax=Evtepia sp. TaxID=2773933 RepID=UPI002A80893C|nr:endonuclease domain-containing protein [Evtepia sp.]MDY3992280.1 endonuclease domain-containing protein [Evtepia sp.]MDY4431397.1 endonuclease domain-containing protein [Evtepia sp.]